MPSPPPDPALSESPAGASLCCPVWGSTLVLPPLVGSFLQRASEILSVLLPPLLVHCYRLVVYSRGAAICLYSLKCTQQRSLRTHLIYQTEPFASFHSYFQCRQHSFRPDTRFRPRPASAHFS